jgi:hypothetical protein
MALTPQYGGERATPDLKDKAADQVGKFVGNWQGAKRRPPGGGLAGRAVVQGRGAWPTKLAKRKHEDRTISATSRCAPNNSKDDHHA